MPTDIDRRFNEQRRLYKRLEVAGVLTGLEAFRMIKNAKELREELQRAGLLEAVDPNGTRA